MREFQASDDGAKVMIAFFDALQYIPPAFRIFSDRPHPGAHRERGVPLSRGNFVGGAGQATSVSLLPFQLREKAATRISDWFAIFSNKSLK